MTRIPKATPLLLGLVAGLYFLAGFRCGVEWFDEGHLVYLSWRTAEGALPYRDFHHLYGPSLFFLNGLLLRTFGADLLVLRIGLLLVKAVTAVLVFVLARRVASPGWSLAAFAAYVALFGSPIWFFNAPYANHHQLLLAFAGLAAYHALAGRPRIGALVAGLAFGLAATFKQTGGLFAFVAFLFFLVWRGRGRRGAGRAMRLAVLGGGLALLVAYGAAGGDLWTGAVLLGPAVVLALALGARELRGADAGGAILPDVVLSGVGFALPLAAYALLYVDRGALGALVDDTLRVLPRRFHWFVPFADPTRPALLAGAALGALFASLQGWRRDGRLRSPFAAGALGAGAATLWLWSRSELPALLTWLPVAAAWAGCLLVVLGNPSPALAAIATFAAVSLLQLSPAADLAHVLMILPVGLPVFAHLATRFTDGPRAGRLAAAGVVTLAGAMLLAPAAGYLWRRDVSCPGTGPGVARASGIRIPDAKAGAVTALIQRLDAAPTFLIVPDEEMTYFLAGRPSALPGDEFTLYLVRMGLVDDADARAMLDQAHAAARLAVMRPPLVRLADPTGRARFARVFPDLDAYLARHYRNGVAIGEYELSFWSDAE